MSHDIHIHLLSFCHDVLWVAVWFVSGMSCIIFKPLTSVNKALAEGVVTEDLADGGKAYGTTEVGDYLAANI